MRTLAVTVLLGVVSHAQIGNQPGSGFHTLLSSAMRYVINYEQQFALLVLEEHYTQELQRRPSDGTSIDGGEETMNGRVLRKAIYREAARPTLIKTTRGRDLALTGTIWIEPFSGAVVKTDMTAADPVVRAQVTVTFRRDEGIDLWVPEKMEEYYRALSGLDDVLATASYTNVRRVLRTELSEQ